MSLSLMGGRLRVLGIPDRCDICGGLLTWQHDHRDDLSGLDDGPPINPPRITLSSERGG